MQKFQDNSKRKDNNNKNNNKILENVKSPYIIGKILSFLYENFKLDIIKYNKYFQKSLSINIEDYKKKKWKI